MTYKVDLPGLDLPPPYDDPSPEQQMYMDAAVEWVQNHTTFVFRKGVDVPAGVRVFIVKYCELMESGYAGGVRSESIAGMSQSFSDGADLDSLVRALAGQLLGPWYKSAGFVPARNRWE